MRRQIAILAAVVLLAAGLSSPVPARAVFDCSQGFVVLDGEDDGSGDDISFCYDFSQIDLSGWSNGSKSCRGAFGFDNGTWNDCFTSVWVENLPASKRFCVYQNASFQGPFQKLGNGHWNFGTGFGHSWPDLTNPDLNDRITSFKFCNP